MKSILSDKKQPAVIGVGALVFSLIAVSWFVFLPALKSYQLLSSAIQEKKTALSAAKPSSGGYEDAENALQKAKREIESVKNKLFWESDVSKFLSEITLMASDLRIDFVSLKPEFSPRQPEKDKGQVKEALKDYSLTEVPILIIIKTNYDNLLTFLQRLERTEKFIGIDSLSIESNLKDIYTHTARMDLVIFTKG